LKSIGVSSWSHDGILCTGESYKDKVKLTFFKGPALADSHACFPLAKMAGQGVRSTLSKATV
jgi:hypothetical protein